MTPVRAFLIDALERAGMTFAQALAAFVAVSGTGLLDLNWTQALSISGAAALTSLLKGGVSAGLTDGTASALPAKYDPAKNLQDNPLTDASTGRHAK